MVQDAAGEQSIDASRVRLAFLVFYHSHNSHYGKVPSRRQVKYAKESLQSQVQDSGHDVSRT